MVKRLISFPSSGVRGHEGAGLLWHRSLHGEEEGGRVLFIKCRSQTTSLHTRSSKAGISASWRFLPRIPITSTRIPFKFDPVFPPVLYLIKPYLSSSHILRDPDTSQPVARRDVQSASDDLLLARADPGFWPDLTVDLTVRRQSTSILSQHRSRSIHKLLLDIFLPSLPARAACCDE